MRWERRLEPTTKQKVKSGSTSMCFDLRRRERCCERWRRWRRRLHDPARPFTLGNLLGYCIRGVIKRATGASSIGGAPICSTSRRRVIGIHVRIVTTCTGGSSVIALGTFALLLSNAVHTRARVH